MKTTTIVAIVLGLLVVISVIQAFQLNGLKKSVAEGKLSTGSSSVKTSVATSAGDTSKATATLPSSVKNLPQMVGGC